MFNNYYKLIASAMKGVNARTGPEVCFWPWSCGVCDSSSDYVRRMSEEWPKTNKKAWREVSKPLSLLAPFCLGHTLDTFIKRGPWGSLMRHRQMPYPAAAINAEKGRNRVAGRETNALSTSCSRPAKRKRHGRSSPCL